MRALVAPGGLVWLLAVAVPGWNPGRNSGMLSGMKPKVFCEDGATTKAVRALQDQGLMTLERFPYERSKNRRIRDHSQPSRLTADMSSLTCDNSRVRTDCWESNQFAEIRRILGGKGQEFDARLIDAAYKSGCVAFVTPDKRDIVSNKVALTGLTGMRFFHADDVAALGEFLRGLPE